MFCLVRIQPIHHNTWRPRCDANQYIRNNLVIISSISNVPMNALCHQIRIFWMPYLNNDTVQNMNELTAITPNWFMITFMRCNPFPYYWPFVRGNPRGGHPHKAAVIWNFDVFSYDSLGKLLNSRFTGDLRRYGVHVTSLHCTHLSSSRLVRRITPTLLSNLAYNRRVYGLPPNSIPATGNEIVMNLPIRCCQLDTSVSLHWYSLSFE